MKTGVSDDLLSLECKDVVAYLVPLISRVFHFWASSHSSFPLLLVPTFAACFEEVLQMPSESSKIQKVGNENQEIEAYIHQENHKDLP